MKLSILVCSVIGRRNTFLPSILDALNSQIEGVNDVELLVLIDNKTRMLGIKRNDLVFMAQGDYIVFVDDDDKIAADYVSTLLQAIDKANGADVITFKVNVSLNGGEFKPCYYSKDFAHDYNEADRYCRLPNHIMCIKKDLCIDTPYEPILYGEDSAFSKQLKPKLNSEYAIDKVLYEYHYNLETTETQQHLRHRIRSRYSKR